MKFFLILGLLLGCDKKDVLEDLTSRAKGLEPYTKQAQEEVEKAYQVEYLVKDFDLAIPAKELNDSLNELGQARWECSSVAITANIRLICKRKPRSVLNYVPRIF